MWAATAVRRPKLIVPFSHTGEGSIIASTRSSPIPIDNTCAGGSHSLGFSPGPAMSGLKRDSACAHWPGASTT